MSDEDNSGRISRRDVLKGTSAGAVGLSFTGAASAESAPDADAMRTLRQSDRVTSILEELGRPNLEARSINSSTVSTERGELTGIGVKTPYGPLFYCEDDGGETGALLHLEPDDRSGRRSARNDKYAAVPADTNAVLIGREDDAVFRREATDAETAAVARVVGRDRIGGDSMVYTGSDVDGFNVDVFDEDDANAGRYQVPVDSSFEPQTENAAAIPEVTTQISYEDAKEAFEDCGSPCMSCASGLGSCASCYFVCAGSPTGVGAILCVFCVKVSCEIGSVVGCSFCIDCLQEHGHL